MESTTAIKRLSALARENRLSVFRLLVSAGPQGLPAGEIARALRIAPATLSTHLGVLTNASLLTSRREGRLVIYAADYERMSELLVYLVKDCCQSRPEVCLSLAAGAAGADHCN